MVHIPQLHQKGAEFIDLKVQVPATVNLGNDLRMGMRFINLNIVINKIDITSIHGKHSSSISYYITLD